jgi:hypothetical protein
MTLDHFVIADPDEQAAYDAIRKVHHELVIAGVLADMAEYGSLVTGPIDDALKGIEQVLRIIRGEA